MLATFQFLPEEKTITYRNENYDFAITYPTSWKSCALSNNDIKENKFLLIVPKEKNCSAKTFIFVSRVPELSGNLISGYGLQEAIKKNGFTKFNPFLNGGSTQAEKTNEKYFFRESYFFTNYETSLDLLKISEQIETGQENFQRQAKEIVTTTQRFLKQNKD
jgi:hypothetical protein